MKVLDLFSGIGGFSLALEAAGMETVAFCEIEPFCQAVLKKHWPDVPIYDDVRTINHDGPVDLICGGYPCQPFSTAGKRQGEDDDRHLWPAMFSLIKRYRPTWVIGENVAGHVSMGLDNVLADLENENYACRPIIIPACGIGAPHRRDRVWIVANNNSVGRGIQQKQSSDCQDKTHTYDHGKEEFMAYTKGNSEGGLPKRETQKHPIIGKCGENVSNTDSLNGKMRCESQQQKNEAETGSGVDGRTSRYGDLWDVGSGNWSIEPRVGRVANGIPRRVDRLKALGNAIVPQIAYQIGKTIMQAEGLKND